MLRMPVVSDTSFADVALSPVEPVLWPIEMSPRQLPTVGNPPIVVTQEHLLWVRDAFGPGAALMNLIILESKWHLV